MKLKSILLSLVIITSLNTKAQVAFGYKGGYTRSSLNGSHAFENNTLKSYTLGGFMQFGGNIFAVQPEILFTQKGGHNYEMLDRINEEYKLNYLEIPVLLKASFPFTNEVFFPHVFVGPYYAAVIASSYNGSITVPDDTRNLNQSDWGVLGGAGLDFRLGRVFLSLDGRYHLGLRSLDSGGNYDTREIRNGTFMITGGVGVRFGY
ncbi:MAG TPA: porin family protein [Flavobacteriales bacterium]|nr:porin family protein [Flavobacteriales bacterium]